MSRGRRGAGAPAAAAALAIALAPLAPACARASGGAVSVRGYALEVAGATGGSAFGAGAGFDLARLRLEAVTTGGAWRGEIASDQLLTWSSHPAGGGVALGRAGAGNGDWLDLDWNGAPGERTRWRHRLDRASVGWRTGPFEAIAGRQPISWATGLVFTPDDPFAPFDPTDPFREYRGGVDALRAAAWTGAFTQLEAVVRPAVFAGDTTWSELARARTTRAGFDLASWGGRLFGRPAAALGVTRSLGGWGARGAVAWRRPGGDTTVVRSTLGADRRVTWLGRDLYFALEWQHDGFGARGAADLPAVLSSAAAARGELVALGRDELALDATWQAHPLLGLEVLALWNAGDGSALVAPAATWSAAQEWTVRGGLFVPLGPTDAVGAGSEYGELPFTGYLSASVFF